MDRLALYSLAENVRQQADTGAPVDIHQLADRLSLLCLNGQERGALAFLQERGAYTPTSAVAAHMGVGLSHANVLLIALLRLGLVTRTTPPRKGGMGRPEFHWCARVTHSGG